MKDGNDVDLSVKLAQHLKSTQKCFVTAAVSHLVSFLNSDEGSKVGVQEKIVQNLLRFHLGKYLY